MDNSVGRKVPLFSDPSYILTTKIAVVISPLISLMHDQCLKLANHGISACFLGDQGNLIAALRVK
jgi:superfamily II DNA helicase RecQ